MSEGAHVGWPEYQLVSVSRLTMDKRYQREVSQKRVDSIVDNFDPTLFGALTVTPRENGDLAVIDGQHRAVAAAIQHLEKVPALITHTTGGAKEEAGQFVSLNTLQKKTTPFQNWQAAAFSDPDSLEARSNEILKSYGLHVASNGGENVIKAVGTLQQILKRGGLPLLHDTIELIYSVWHGMDNAYADKMIKGVATFLWTYEGKIDMDKLKFSIEEDLRSPGSNMTPTRIMQKAGALQGIQLSLISNMLLKNYNSKIKSKHQYRESRYLANAAYVGWTNKSHLSAVV